MFQSDSFIGLDDDRNGIGTTDVLPGDANVDGRVDFTDLVAIAQNYNSEARLWQDGDFTHDGRVDFRPRRARPELQPRVPGRAGDFGGASRIRPRRSPSWFWPLGDSPSVAPGALTPCRRRDHNDAAPRERARRDRCHVQFTSPLITPQ